MAVAREIKGRYDFKAFTFPQRYSTIASFRVVKVKTIKKGNKLTANFNYLSEQSQQT